MGKPTGFLEYDRVNGKAAAPLERIKNFNEFHTPLTEAQQRKQGARCMECGVPFCQSGMMMNGMVSGCPLPTKAAPKARNQANRPMRRIPSRSANLKNGIGFGHGWKPATNSCSTLATPNVWTVFWRSILTILISIT